MKTLLATLVGATLMATLPAQATDFFLEIKGIKGGSAMMKGYEGQIPVLSWSWGLSNSGSAASGPGNVNLQDLNWTQYADGSMVDLFRYLTDPDLQLGKATLSAVSTGASGYNFFQLVFDNNLITSVQIGGQSSEDPPGVAQVSMSMGEVTLRYLPNKGGTWAEASYRIPPNATFASFSGNPMAFEGLRMAMSPAVAVPEPASWLMMIIGFGFVGHSLRRRRSRASTGRDGTGRAGPGRAGFSALIATSPLLHCQAASPPARRRRRRHCRRAWTAALSCALPRARRSRTRAAGGVLRETD
jgi:type VI secretion system secreted protein Hcp